MFVVVFCVLMNNLLVVIFFIKIIKVSVDFLYKNFEDRLCSIWGCYL